MSVVFSYVQYSNIAARTLRAALKEPAKSLAAKQDGLQVKVVHWKDGKAISKSTFLPYTFNAWSKYILI